MAALVFFDSAGAWGETLVCEGLIRQRLQALGIPTEAPPAEDTSLVYFPRPEGWVALLCEAGEPLPPATTGTPPAELPDEEEFIARLLEMMGEDPDT